MYKKKHTHEDTEFDLKNTVIENLQINGIYVHMTRFTKNVVIVYELTIR